MFWRVNLHAAFFVGNVYMSSEIVLQCYILNLKIWWRAHFIFYMIVQNGILGECNQILYPSNLCLFIISVDRYNIHILVYIQRVCRHITCTCQYHRYNIYNISLTYTTEDEVVYHDIGINCKRFNRLASKQPTCPQYILHQECINAHWWKYLAICKHSYQGSRYKITFFP